MIFRCAVLFALVRRGARRYLSSMDKKYFRWFVRVLAASVLIAAGPWGAAAAGTADVGVTACDRLVSLPFDTERVAEPPQGPVDLEHAIAVCRADLRKFPDHPRLLLQLGALVDRRPRLAWTPPAALPILQKAAEGNYLAARYYLAEVMLRSWGQGLRRKGAALMLDAARAGHPEAQAQISYHVGRLDEAGRAEALALAETAAARGHYGAMAAIADAYLMVLADPDNYEKAVAYLEKADEKGDHDAMALLGRLQLFPFAPNRLRGLIPENPYGGMDRLHRAAKAGNRRASYYLGLVYAGATNHIPANRAMMIRWFCRAGERGRYMVAEILEEDVAEYRCPEETARQ